MFGEKQISYEEFKAFLLDLVFPSFCLCCHQRTKKYLCSQCAEQLFLFDPYLLAHHVQLHYSFPISAVFEESRVAKILLEKMVQKEYFPLLKIVASYVVYQLYQMNWPFQMQVFSFDSTIAPLGKKIEKLLGKKNISSSPILLLIPFLEQKDKMIDETVQFYKKKYKYSQSIYVMTLMMSDRD